MIKYLVIAAAVLAFNFTAASAGEKNNNLIDRVLLQAAEDQEIFAKFLLGTASFREKTAQRALLTRISDWLSTNFELAHATERPKVAYASSAKLVALRYNGLAVGATREATGSMQQIGFELTTVALYRDAEKTIYLPEEWTGGSAAELSVLVHEMVHHLQNLGDIRYECPRAREKLAYAAQDKFLQLFGSGLESEFEVNPFTVFVRSTCAY